MSRRASVLVVLWVMAGAPEAPAAVAIGQLAPIPTNTCATGSHVDYLQESVSSGPSYVVPSDGGATAWTVTSWSHNPSSSSGEIKMKVFRKVAEPSFYEAVGHDGPHPFTPAVVNTFPVNIAVKPGDVLGFNAVGSTACRFDGDSNLLNGPADLPDGQQASFAGVQSGRLNVSATVTPTNSFTVGALARNRKRGTATLTIDLPNPGNLTITGPGVSAAGGRAETATAVAAGRTKVTIRARGKKRRTLNETGKVKLRATVSYTPSGGEPNTQPLKVKLRKRHL